MNLILWCSMILGIYSTLKKFFGLFEIFFLENTAKCNELLKNFCFLTYLKNFIISLNLFTRPSENTLSLKILRKGFRSNQPYEGHELLLNQTLAKGKWIRFSWQFFAFLINSSDGFKHWYVPWGQLFYSPLSLSLNQKFWK